MSRIKKRLFQVAPGKKMSLTGSLLLSDFFDVLQSKRQTCQDFVVSLTISRPTYLTLSWVVNWFLTFSGKLRLQKKIWSSFPS